MISLNIGYSIPSPETVVGDNEYNTHSTKKTKLSGIKLDGVLYVMKDNTKIIVIAMNESETKIIRDIAKQWIVETLDI